MAAGANDDIEDGGNNDSDDEDLAESGLMTGCMMNSDPSSEQSAPVTHGTQW